MIMEIHSLTVVYDTGGTARQPASRPALNDVSMDVKSGEILGLIGPNGAGKTTLMRAVSGVLPVQSGEVLVSGTDIRRLSISQRARLLAVVPQARQMGGAYTVEQAVMMGRTAYMSWLGRSSQSDEDAVKLALQRTDLEDFAERSIASLSGGEQQRVLLARALAQSTPVLLLDEPTNHLDLHHQVNLLTLIRQLAEEQQLAVMVAMHDLNQASMFADRLALLVNGQLHSIGKPQQVLTRENIRTAYQTDVEIVPHPISGQPVIFPAEIVRAGATNYKADE